jgi:transcription antitermination factor NusG
MKENDETEIEKATDKKWYALYTAPRAEKQVKEKLEANDITCYLPLHRTPRVWSDRVKLVDIPLFHSYIFVCCKPAKVLSMNRINGVVRVVFYNGKPAEVRPEEIEAIRYFLKEAEGKPLCAGEEVEILAGSFKKQSGTVLWIKRKYLALRIECVSANVIVNTEYVAPVKRLK